MINVSVNNNNNNNNDNNNNVANINIGNNNNNANNMNMIKFTPMNGRQLRLMKRKKRSSLFTREVVEDICLQSEAGKAELGLIALEAVRMFIQLEQDSEYDPCKTLEAKSNKFNSPIEKVLLKKLAKGASIISTGKLPACVA